VIQLAQRHQKLVRDILKEKLTSQKVYVFGSRATNKAQEFSDLDLCLEGEKLSFSKIAELKDAFSESDLPYFVDIVQKSRLSNAFYLLVKRDFVEFVL